MILKKLGHSRGDWELQGKGIGKDFDKFVTLSNINLIVGKNATGKTTTIDILRQLSDLLSGEVDLSELIYDTGKYHVIFEHNNQKIEYILDYVKGKVEQEILNIDDVMKLDRKEQQLFYSEINRFLTIEIEDHKLLVSRTDKKQHPFLEVLYNWGKNATHFRFGGQLGKDTFLRDINSVKDEFKDELKNIDNVAELFIVGKNKFGDSFEESIIQDLRSLSYQVTKVDTKRIKRFSIPVFGLEVYEADRGDVTDQIEMSQGMFRVLSLLIQLNYSLFAKSASCILIDDIGEGLDYDRSKELIKIIVDKIKGTEIQVFMTTNDRFVMNEIPLEYWSVIHRLPKKSVVFNFENSKEIFEEFKFTGLSNFDFLKTEYYFDLDI